MSSHTFADTLEAIENFHRDLADCYENFTQDCASDEVRKLLGVLFAHEQRAADRIARFREDVDEDLLETWLQYPADFAPEEICQEGDLKRELSVSEMMDLAFGYDREMRAQIDTLCDGAAPAVLHPSLEELIDLEESKDMSVFSTERLS